MSNPATYTPRAVRWRRLPSHAQDQGWVGIPYDAEGKRVDESRLYVLRCKGYAEPYLTCFKQQVPGFFDAFGSDWLKSDEALYMTEAEARAAMERCWEEILAL